MANNPSEGLLLPENKKTLFFRQIDEIVKSLNNQSEVKAEQSQLLIELLIQDIMENQLSREYRISLCYKLIEKENLFKKILACNIIQDMVKIIQGHTIQQDIETTGSFDQSSVNEKSKHSIIPDGNEGINVSVQTHLDRYVLKHKFVTSQPIIPVYIILFLKRLEYEYKKNERNNDSLVWDSNMNSIISDFVCRLAKYVNHPIVYATLLSEGETYLNSTNESTQIFKSLMLESVEKTYHLSNFENVSSLEYQEYNYGLLPENVQHKLLTACSEKKTENTSYFQNLKTLIVKKRVYDSALKANHVLFSDDLEEVLKHESTSFEPLKRLKTETSDYLALRARSLLYRNCFNSPTITHRAKTFFDVSMTIARFKDFETSKRIAFDKLLLSLSEKPHNYLIIEEYATPRIESKQIERPSPHIDCMEDFSALCELCNLQKNPTIDSINISEKSKPDLSHINLVFLGELFKNLINLGDWAFIRDFFKQIQTVYEQNTSDDVHIVFCRFAILVESLAYHMHAPRNGAPKKVFKDLKDDIYKFVNNLIYLPDQYHYESDSLNFEDENRLRWDDFHLLVSTNNLKFLMDLSVMLSFVLVSVRMTVVGNRSTSPPMLRNPTQPIMTGHYKHLAKLIMPEYFCSSTKKNWLLGNEKFVEDTLIIMLQHVLERVINLQEQSSTKPISSFYLFKCCLADVYFEKGKFRRALELYLECGEMSFPHFYKPSNEEVVERMFRCLVELGEYTAAAVLHQFVHSTYDNEIESQSRTHVISDNFINTNNRIGYTKEIIDNLYESNGLNERWLLYFYDLSYLELVVHVAHQKGEFSKEDLIIQHIQRSEINSNNKTEHRKEYIQAMKETFLRRLYLHITTFLKN
ncbi:predicted protein [Naegleria gruberi]|uniref:Predicted protein n=1 Tax=Naegleria gruberi TaxID=5762 RepID=D2UXP6_NAEGR|nr:uncharacterized protein NAEGRDRAFT_61199 [Naegleria gruberi]EFC50323.1 predicted protein [Naegleria gruberi]|eukprot:XP_002683067.1 predicted protein [Naegleria gruberi strain NEG-M]